MPTWCLGGCTATTRTATAPFDAHAGAVHGLRCGPLARLASCGDDGTVRVYDILDAAAAQSCAAPSTMRPAAGPPTPAASQATLVPREHTAQVHLCCVRGLAWTADGASLWTCGWDGAVQRLQLCL